MSKGKLIWIPDYDDEPSGCAIFAVVIIIGLILFGLSKCGIIEDPGYIDNTNENTQVDYTAEYVGIASFPYESDYVEQTEGKYDVKKYPTNGYFQYFFGSLSVGYGSPNDVIEILIYADNTLVYRSGDINYDTGSIELKINVNQCNTLKIVKFQPSTNENNNIQCTINNGYLTNKEVDLYTAVKGLETSGDEGFSGFYGENHVIENFYGQPFNGPVFYIWTGTNEAVEDGNGYYGRKYIPTYGGAYKYFKGTLFVNANARENYLIEFKVYADGVLVYTSGAIGSKTQPIDFSLDINNCNELRIEVFTESFYRATDDDFIKCFIANGKLCN